MCRSRAELQAALDAPLSRLGGSDESHGCGEASITLEGVASPWECSECLTLLASRAGGLAGLATLRLKRCPLRTEHIAQLAAVLRACGGGERGRAQPVASAGGDEDVGDDECYDLFGDAGGESVSEAVAEAYPARGTAASGSSAGVTNEAGAEPASRMLTAFVISHCQDVPTEAWTPLWTDLPATLRTLELTRNNLSDHAISALCGTLRRGKCPRRLLLRGNRCKDIERLCALVAGGDLRELDVSENLLNDKSAAQLAEALDAPECALSELNASGNSRLSSAGLKKLVQGRLQRCSLRHLELAHTSCCDSGAEALAAELSSTITSTGTCQMAPCLEFDLTASRVSSLGARLLLGAVQQTQLVGGLTVDEGGECVRWRRLNDPLDLFAC